MLNKSKVYEKAQAFMQKGQWEKALESMYQVHADDGSDPHITMRIGDLNKKLGRVNDATDFYFKTANMYAADKQITKAAATYKMILRMNPSLTEVRERLDELSTMRPPGTPLTIDPVATGSDDDGGGGFEIQHGSAAYCDLGQSPTSDNRADGKFCNLDKEKPVSKPVASAAPQPSSSSSMFDDFAADVVAPSNDGPAPEPASGKSAGKVEFLSDLQDEELWELLGRMDRLTFGPGEAIIREGDQGDSIYIINEGRVRVTVNVDGKIVLLAELGEQDFFGEVSFLTGKPRTATVTASDTTHILELKRSEVDDLIERYPHVEQVLDMFHKTRVADTVSSINLVTMGML